jgi:hypothetical protein
MGCYNTCVVTARADEVWAKMRNFHDLSWAEPVISSLEVVGEPGSTTPGAKRVLNGAFHETLLSVDDERRRLTYSIDDGPDAVAKSNVQGYVTAVRVLPVTDSETAFVEWSSTWTESKGGVADFCNPIYRALLDQLKAHFA